MARDDTREGERRETIDELSDVIRIAQEMGRRLANETHGSPYAHVEELNRLLHQTHRQLSRIEGCSAGGLPQDCPDNGSPEPVALE